MNNKAALILLLIVSMFSIRCLAQSYSRIQADTSEVPAFYATVNGKQVKTVLSTATRDKSFLAFQIRQPFMENDTLYIWREFHLWRFETCSTYDTCVNSYFIISRKNKNHQKETLKCYYVKDPDFKKDTFLGKAYFEWRNDHPELTLERRNLDDMSRHWFMVKKYQGQYVLTCDFPYGITFTDSMIVYHEMESWFSQYGAVKKMNAGTYYYEAFYYDHESKGWPKSRNWLYPSILDKGLYVNAELRANGELYYTLVTPQENLRYFDLIQSKICEVDDYLEYDTVDYETHTSPSLMAEIHASQKKLQNPASSSVQKMDTEDVEWSGHADWFCSPEFPGGKDSLNDFIQKNLHYPSSSDFDRDSCVVLLEFVVEVDGSITNPKVIVSVNSDFDAEAVRLVKSMPKWVWPHPERCYGGVVERCYYVFPVWFRK